ncbi:MAG TPA: hypothetical protein VH109_13950 [Steroidobacteraceae bacterium]|jgi:hypothetical protein|nr:hypothetical protein [Steroidobacteraceae bacterium]
MAEVLVSFRGRVRTARAAAPPELTLSGVTAAHPDEPSLLAFVAPGPVTLPGELSDALVERLGAGSYRIRAAGVEWLFDARGAHVHRDAAAPFYRAVPPRPMPAARRFFLRLVLALAASRAGLAVLRVLRG